MKIPAKGFTHGGKFHADDVFSTALLQILRPDIQVTRGFVVPDDFDGIVYAVCIGMGFAAIENVLYLFDNYESWISVGIARALFAVPGHFLDAVIMGFYYSLWHFRILRNWQTCALILVGPILAHGIYDSIVFSMNIDDSLSGILLLLFLLFLNKLKNICKKHIADLVNH